MWNHSPAATMTTRDCWPDGVATESDNWNFLKLLFANAPRTDLTQFLPTWSWDQGIFKSCFLTFVSGINHVNDLKMIEVLLNIFQDQRNWEAQILRFPILLVLKNMGYQVSDRIHDVTGTLNGNNCDCQISFWRG